MQKTLLAGVALLVAFLAGSPAAQDAGAVVANASQAIGVNALKTVQFSATGHDFALGQAPNPSSPWPKFVNKSYSRSIDFEGRASRVERVRMQGENPPRGGGQQPIVGEQPVNQTIVVANDTPWVQQLEIVMMPHGFLRAAAARNATVEAKTIGGKKYNVITFTGDNKAKVNGYVNDRNLVERVETWIDNPFFGDMPFEAIYSEYKDVGGAQFPMHIVQKQGGYPIFDLTVTDVKANAPVAIQAAQGRGGAGAPAAVANAAAASEPLGDGVYLITGGYAAIAIDMKDHILLLESGQSEARGQAVIAEAKRLIPNKPVKYVVNTHSHVDHSSGLRAAVSEGATILTHQMNKAYLEKTLAVPHTLSPDKAQQNGKKPVVEAVSEKKVLTDGTHTVELHHLQNFGHHDAMLIAYLPKEKVLLEADGYNPQATTATPPNPPSPYTLSLLDNIRRLKLDVQRIVPVHLPPDGRAVTMAELTKWVGRPATN
ncbi:MAG TPA: MBL fold metallo-hydrolase [Vicinamibacterales bacterium]|nr:MBL fold metallo-hydrolase [Vicinamibacterales bacterium]